MKALMIIKTKEEYNLVNRLFDQAKRDIASGEKWNNGNPRVYTTFDGMIYTDNESCGCVMDMDKPNFYYYNEKGEYEIFNFTTMEHVVIKDGDLAGLCNSDNGKNGNFPF